MSSKSLQTCSCCGWSKVTTYQGLRTHQGKKGCTPKGLSIPESEQFHYLPQITFLPRSPIQLQDPFFDIFKNALNSESDHYFLGSQWGEYNGNQKNNLPIVSTSVKVEKALVSPNLIPQMNPAPQQVSGLEVLKPLAQSDQQALQMEPNLDKKWSVPNLTFGSQKLDLRLQSEIFTTQMSPPIMQTSSVVKAEQKAPQKETNSHKSYKAPDFSFERKQVDLTPPLQNFTVQMVPPTTQTPFKDSKESFFQTPLISQQSSLSSDKVRRTLDFSLGPLKVEQPCLTATTTAQEAVSQPKEKEQEAKSLQKVIRDRMRADLQLKALITEQKMAEISSSVKTCQDGLDAEWMEINNVFSEVIRAVEDARQKALEPVEKRRLEVKREAQDLLHELQRETDRLKDSLDVLDKNPDQQVSLLSGLDESTDLKNFNIDTSFSFGTLRATTTTMMEEIQQKLENLTPLELKRISVFSVDVKLDSATAHQCLILSNDRKKVRDGGMMPKLSDAPERFDMFGSVLGINIITSGKSYWEVEVGNKTGWDLGVARRRANRKGILAVNSENGYWVTVHYEDNKYAGLTVPPVSLSLKQKPQKVGVFVDYDGGLVSFYNVTNRSHIFSFTECLFGDEIVPYFSPHLKLNDNNTDPLVISAVVKL